jgi:hypothetical protein
MRKVSKSIKKTAIENYLREYPQSTWKEFMVWLKNTGFKYTNLYQLQDYGFDYTEEKGFSKIN